MTKLFIPPLGTVMVLNKAWTFGLHYETRNRKLWDLKFAPPEMGEFPNRWKTGFQEVQLVTLGRGTRLTVDRIYIRAQQGEYDSVTFRAQVYHLGVIRKVRFWAKLDDVNRIDFGDA